jgi:hypothetical protein
VEVLNELGELVPPAGSTPTVSWNLPQKRVLDHFKMIHSLRPAVCSLCQQNIDKQRRSKIHFQPYKLGSVVVAQGAAYCPNGLCRQGHECGMPQGGHWSWYRILVKIIGE